MKKYFICLFTSILACSFIPTNGIAATLSYKTETPVDSAATRLILMNRLEQIGSTDKSLLSHSEKAELRKEERAIKQSLSDGYGGVYISVGALLIIILILIILL